MLVKGLLEERALAVEHYSDADLHTLGAAMDEARARRLQPHDIESTFKDAFTRLGGRIVKCEQGRYEIANVPQHVRSVGNGPIATKYDHVTFGLGHVQSDDRAHVDLLVPGHPLHDAVMAETIRNFGGALNPDHRPRLGRPRERPEQSRRPRRRTQAVRLRVRTRAGSSAAVYSGAGEEAPAINRRGLPVPFAGTVHRSLPPISPSVGRA